MIERIGSRAILALLIGLAAFHFGIAFLPFEHEFIPDEAAYYQLAYNMVDKGVYALDAEVFHERAGAPNTYFAPGWPAALAAGYFILPDETAFWLVSSICWSLSIVALWWLAKALKLPPSATAVVLLWFSLNPLLIYYHLHLMTETLAVLLVAALLACGISMLERWDWKLAFLLGLLTAAAFLTRTALVLIPAAIWVVAFWKSRQLKTVKLFGIFASVFVIAASPWLWRMHSVGAGFTASELKMGQNLYLYNYTEVANPYQLKPDENVPFPDGLEDMTPLERDRLLTRLGLQSIFKHPARYALNCLRRVYYLISPTPNFVSAGRLYSAAMFLSTVIFLYIPWALLGFALWRRPGLDWKQWILLLAVAFWFLVHVAVHASVRQRLPSDLIGVVLCASKVTELFRSRKRQDRSPRDEVLQTP